MILTLTINPSIDLALDVATLEIGEVNRAASVRRDPAGKGVNVAKALVAHGVDSVALFPADDLGGAELIRLLKPLNVDAVTTPIKNPIRTNITITDDAGNTTKINEAGPELSKDELDALLEMIRQSLETKPRWLVASGSLPPGVPTDFYASIGKLARRFGVPFAVDTSGEPLKKLVDSGQASLIKPNDEELGALLGTELLTVGDVVTGTRKILAPDASALVSLGSHGALLVAPGNYWWGGAPAVKPVSTVGAGDSTLAGFLSVDSDDPAQQLATAVAFGTAAVQLPGSKAPGPDDLDLDVVKTVLNPDPSTPLGELGL